MGYTERLPTEIKAFPRPSGDGASLIAIHYVFFCKRKLKVGDQRLALGRVTTGGQKQGLEVRERPWHN